MFRRTLCSLLVASATLAGTEAALAQNPVNRPQAAPERLIIGDGYVVKVRRGQAEQRIVGDLAGASPYWIVLRCRSVSNEAGVPEAPRNSLGPTKIFQNVGRTVTDELVWIPCEAALVERHSPRASRLPPPNLTDEAPPRQAPCTVELAAGFQVARQEGEILGWTGPTLALAQQAGRTGQRIAHDQILCIRFRQPR
jgi:hypothetical protein